MNKDDLQAISDLLDKKLDEKLEPIKKDIQEIKAGQKDIKKTMEEIETKNANKHMEMLTAFEELRDDMTTIEVIANDVTHIKNDVESIKTDLNRIEIQTAGNWLDIAKLKAVR